MTGSQTFSNLTRQAIEEHRHIVFYLDQLERSLVSLDAGTADLEALRRMAARIDGVRERLVEHFASEEVDGLFRALGEALPETRGAVLELAGEHAKLLTLLDLARVRAQHGQADEAQLLRGDLESFLRLAREHETQEEALLARAMRNG